MPMSKKPSKNNNSMVLQDERILELLQYGHRCNRCTHILRNLHGSTMTTM